MSPLILLLACADPAKDKTPAAVAPAPPARTEAPVSAPSRPPPLPGAETLVPIGTIGFTGAKVTRSHDGTLPDWTGELSLKGGALARVWFEVDIRTITVGIEKLDHHLRTPDFFDADAFPSGSFVSTAITPGAPANNQMAGATHTVEGDMVLRGHSRHLTFPAAIDVTPTEVKARAEFVINRKDFGIEYTGKADDLVRDEVAIRVDVTAPRTPGAATPAPEAAAGNPPSGTPQTGASAVGTSP